MKNVLKTYDNQFDNICNFYTHHFLKETMVFISWKCHRNGMWHFNA